MPLPSAIDLANRLALRPVEAAQVLGLSERKLREILPRLPTVRAGTAVLIPIGPLMEWLARNATAGEAALDSAVHDALRHLGSRREKYHTKGTLTRGRRPAPSP